MEPTLARDTTDDTPIESRDALVATLEAGCKPRDAWRIGTEHEKFPFYADTLTPVPYEGEDGRPGIRDLLEGMQARTGWTPITDDGRIIGLAGGKGEGAISLEPGGQFELSGAPVETIHQTCRESNVHLAHAKRVGDDLGIRFLGVGGSPKWPLDATPEMPKSRYDIMRRYMPKMGENGLDMMHRTCTIQVNLDFASEADMARKMWVSTRLQPVASALFAASPFTDGAPNGWLTWRQAIWLDTDNDRAGLHRFMAEPGLTFEKYVDWALARPMYFVVRDGRYIDMTHITFADFMKEGADGPDGRLTANMGDWTNHLSTLFPDVRLKQFLEMRGADGGPWRRICALPALWVGLLYDGDALDAAEELAAGLPFEAVREMRAAVPAKGLDAPAGNRRVLDVARDAVALAREGLERRAKPNVNGDDETHFLAPLEETVALEQTQAERMLKSYHSTWERNIDHVFEEYAY